MSEKIKLKEVTSEAIYLGKMSMIDAANLAKKLLTKSGIEITEDMWIHCLQNPQASSQKRFEGLEIDRYLRRYFNKDNEPWTVSDTAGSNVSVIYTIDDLYINTPENKDHGGYCVGKYYVYKKGGNAPKKGHKTYEDAKAEINRIRTADINERCKDFMIFKCVGINYAELEYKEIKGE